MFETVAVWFDSINKHDFLNGLKLVCNWQQIIFCISGPLVRVKFKLKWKRKSLSSVPYKNHQNQLQAARNFKEVKKLRSLKQFHIETSQ